MGKTVKVDITMYGIAEVLHWCHDRNKGRIPGVDTAGFEKMKALLAEKPQSGDYFTLDQRECSWLPYLSLACSR